MPFSLEAVLHETMRYLLTIGLVMIAVYFWTDYDVADLCANAPRGDACLRAKIHPEAYFIGRVVGCLPIPLVIAWATAKGPKSKTGIWLASSTIVALGLIVAILLFFRLNKPASAVSQEPDAPTAAPPAEVLPRELTDAEKCSDLKAVMGSSGYAKRYSDDLVTLKGVTFDSNCNPILSGTLNVYTDAFDVATAKANVAKQVCVMFDDASTPSTQTQVTYAFQNRLGVRFPNVVVERRECGAAAILGSGEGPPGATAR